MNTLVLTTSRALLIAAAVFSLLLLLLGCSPVLAAEPKPCVAIRAMEPRLPEGVQRAWGQPSKFWPQKSTIRIRFLSGTKKQKAEAWKRFQQIDALVNLSFAQVASGPSEVRVRFDRGKGHWSYLGTDARIVSSTAQTMNLDLAAGVFGDFADEWDRVAIHECLHAIGLEHEHQHPKSAIIWNKAAVYEYYGRTQGWSKEQIDFQVLNRATTARYVATAFDGTSMMEYPIPPGLANIVVDWNRRLSKSDVEFISRIYP